MSDSDGVTRRAALTRFAALAGGLAAGSLAPSAVAGAAVAGGFDKRRRRVFAALAEAFDGQGQIKTAARDMVGEMARRYADGSDAYRTWVDSFLDAVDSAPSGLRLSALDAKTRKQTLKKWSRATEPADALMQRAPNATASEPSSLVASNQRMAKRIADIRASIAPDVLRPDPKTGLPTFAPVVPPQHPITDGRGPLETPVRMRRYLYHTSYVLLASFVVGDAEHLTSVVMT